MDQITQFVEALGAAVLAHSNIILPAVAFYIALRWLPADIRAWILAGMVVSVLVGIFVYEMKTDMEEPSPVLKKCASSIEEADSVAEPAMKYPKMR